MPSNLLIILPRGEIKDVVLGGAMAAGRGAGPRTGSSREAGVAGEADCADSGAAALAVALAGGLTAAGTAQAAGKIYVGAKLGMVDYDASGFDNAFAVGAYGGYNLLGQDAHWNADLAGGTLAVEGEVMLTAIQGDTNLWGDWDLTSVGAYAAYRHSLTDAFYLKGKLGVVRYEIDTDFPVGVQGIGTGTETALAAGMQW